MSLLSTYFSKNRNLAIGIAAAGSATGGMIFPAIVRELLPRIGFAWTIRTMGFLMLAIGTLTAVCLKQRLPPRKSGPLVEWSAFREATYSLYCLGMFLNFWGLYFAFYYAGSFGRNIIGISYGTSVSLLILMNGIGIITRIAPNMLADRVTGPLNTMIPFGVCSGIMMFAWSGVHTETSLWIFGAIYGFVAAGMQSLFPAVLASLTEDPKKVGTRMGMGFSIVSVACLTGTPLGGALIESKDGEYLYAQMWAGGSLILGSLTLVAARVAKTGWKLYVKI